MIRKELEKKKESIKNKINKFTNKPTLKSIFMVFQGVHQITMEEEEWINNLNVQQKKILEYFSLNCQKYYCC